MDPDNRAALFDAWAAGYNRTLETATGFPFAGYAQVLEAIVEVAQPQPALAILDAGSGTGNLAALFVARRCAVTGIDFSAQMNARAQVAVPDAVFLQVDLRGSWASLGRRRFDRVVSAYVFHEFDLATKLALCEKLVHQHLHPDGSLIIGDIAFPTARAYEQAYQQWQQHWDAEEYYWVADEAVAEARRVGLQGTYQQISPCAGVFHFRR